MASLADLIFQSASQGVSAPERNKIDMAGSFAQGAQLALKARALGQQKQQLQQTQQAARYKAIDGTLKVIAQSQKFKNEADQRRFLKGALPGAVQAYQTEDVFTPEMQEMLINSKDSRMAVANVRSRVLRGEMTAEEGMRFLDIQGLGDAVEIQSMQEAEKFALSEEGRDARSKDQIEAARVKQQMEFQQFPIKEVQKKVTADWSKFNSSGGLAYVNDKLKKVDNAIGKLKGESPEVRTGTWGLLATTSIPFTDKMDMIRKTNPEVALLMDELQGIVDVKKALDSQFSDAMANRVFSRIIDPNAPNKANLDRIRAYGQTILNEANTQMGTFKSQGLNVGGDLYTPTNLKTSQGQNRNIPESADADPQRQTEEMVAPQFSQEDINTIQMNMAMDPRFKDLEGEGLFAKIKETYPNLPDDTIRQIIRKDQIKNMPQPKGR